MQYTMHRADTAISGNYVRDNIALLPGWAIHCPPCISSGSSIGGGGGANLKLPRRINRRVPPGFVSDRFKLFDVRQTPVYLISKIQPFAIVQCLLPCHVARFTL